MCSPVRRLRLPFPICVLKMSGHALSIGFGANRIVSIGSAEPAGCQSRAGVVRKEKSILAAAVVRRHCSLETQRTPIRSAHCRQIAHTWTRCCATSIHQATTRTTGPTASIQYSRRGCFQPALLRWWTRDRRFLNQITTRPAAAVVWADPLVLREDGQWALALLWL